MRLCRCPLRLLRMMGSASGPASTVSCSPPSSPGHQRKMFSRQAHIFGIVLVHCLSTCFTGEDAAQPCRSGTLQKRVRPAMCAAKAATVGWSNVTVEESSSWKELLRALRSSTAPAHHPSQFTCPVPAHLHFARHQW